MQEKFHIFKKYKILECNIIFILNIKKNIYSILFFLFISKTKYQNNILYHWISYSRISYLIGNHVLRYAFHIQYDII